MDPSVRHRHRRRAGRWTALLVALFSAGILVVAAPWGMKLGSVESDGATDQLPASAESTRAVTAAATLPGEDSHAFLVVYHRPDGLTDDDRAAAQRHLTATATRYSNAGQRLAVSPDETTALFPLSVGQVHGDATEVAADLRATVAERPPDLAAKVTGPAGVEADLDGIFANIDFQLLMATVAVVAILLILTYRSPVLWIVPLVAVGCAALLSMAAVYAAVKMVGITVSPQTASILQVLVFGTGTDYALLIVARYRDELRTGKDVPAAMGAALRGAGPAVVASAATVVAGLLCLLAADVIGVRDLGPAAAIGIVCTLVVMTTMFPAWLVLLGRWVFWPKVPRLGAPARPGSGGWGRLGSALSRWPWTAVLLSVLLLGAGATGLREPAGSLGQAEVFTKKPESVAGLELVARSFPGVGGSPLTVLARPAHRDEVLTAVQATPGVLRAAPGRVGTAWAEVTATPAAAADTPGERDTIVRLRDRVHAVAGADAIVGGRSAEVLDQTTANKRDRERVIPLILLVVTMILMLLLRSIVAALLLVATVVLSFAAAMGVSLLVFKHVFEFPGLGATTPLFGFLFLVALGVDYNIFLMSRAREDAHRYGTRDGMVAALGSTGGVITSAGLVLAATFAVLTMLPLVFMVELGFLVAFGVLLDAFLVRSVLVPSLAFGFGRHLWWPGRLSRATVQAAPATPNGRSPGAAAVQPAPGLDQLTALAARARAEGTAVRIQVTGQPDRLPPPIDAAAFRIVQEALITAVRHARLPEVTIDIEYGGFSAPVLRLAVSEDQIGGFRVEAWLPLAARGPDGPPTGRHALAPSSPGHSLF